MANQRRLLAESKLTDEERREIRCIERGILHEIKENFGELAKVTCGKFQKTTNELDHIYERVCFPREANLDAFNLHELNTAVTKQSQSLQSNEINKYSAKDLIQNVQEKCASQDGQLNWHALGITVGPCFRTAPQINFFYGLLDTEVEETQRKRAKRTAVQENAEESQPTRYISSIEEKDAQAQRLQTMEKTLQKHTIVSVMDAVLCPQSFTQTVENMFDMSFLVRNGTAEIGLDQTESPYLKYHENRADEQLPAQSQTIISMTPQEWKEISIVTERKQPLVGTR